MLFKTILFRRFREGYNHPGEEKADVKESTAIQRSIQQDI